MLELKILGRLELTGPAGRIDLSSAKLGALLAYLAMRGPKAETRESLAALLWGSHFEEQARQNFRQALVRLRKIIGPEVIVGDDAVVQIAPDRLSSDVGRFESLLRDGSLSALRHAVAIADGELLAGVDIKEAAWEEWLASERRRIGGLACDAQVKLGELEMESGDAAAAFGAAADAIRRDEFREDAHRLVMRSLAKLGRRAEALKHYQSLSERLRRELGAAPEAETVRSAESIRGSEGVSASPPPTHSVAEKPSIAVMAFDNLSNDPEQEYFADGIVEEIITALSRHHWLLVIARNSSFTYKGRAVDVKQIGREQGVRYVLEGSVRKAGNRVRIAGQLIDASNGATLWADRFEGELSDIFDLQDQVTARVVTAIAPRLEEAEIERSKRKPTESLDAYDCYLRGLAGLHLWTQKGNEEALLYFTRAIGLDPEFASAYGMAARCYSQRKSSGWARDDAFEKAEARRLARRAAELGRDDAVALGTAGFVLAYMADELADGDVLIERALSLNPNFAWGWMFSGWVKAMSGEPETAIKRSTRALQLSPHDPHIYSLQMSIAFAHFIAGRYDEALAAAELASRLQPDRFTYLATIAASAALTGKLEKAGLAIARLREIEPDLRLGNLAQRFPIKRPEDYARWAEGLRKAGLPE